MKNIFKIIALLILSFSGIQSAKLKVNSSRSYLGKQLDIISTRTLLNLFHADPDQFDRYFEVIPTNVYDFLDIDLRKTKDGVWININKDTFKGKKIDESTYKEICSGKKKRCPIKFEALLDFAVKNNVNIGFEDKSSPTGNLKEIAKLVEDHNALDRVYFAKNSYELLDKALDFFKNVRLYDVWGDGCTEKQAVLLYEKSRQKGGYVILNTSINNNKYLTPKQVKLYAKKGFLVEVGFNWTDSKKNDFVDFFRKYDIKYVNSIIIDGNSFDEYKNALREVYGF